MLLAEGAFTPVTVGQPVAEGLRIAGRHDDDVGGVLSLPDWKRTTLPSKV